MTDYTELVKELLRVGTCAPGYEPLLSKAADAIEELAAFQKQLKDNPPVNEKMIRAMFRSMGRTPSEKQIREIMRNMNSGK